MTENHMIVLSIERTMYRGGSFSDRDTLKANVSPPSAPWFPPCAKDDGPDDRTRPWMVVGAATISSSVPCGLPCPLSSEIVWFTSAPRPLALPPRCDQLGSTSEAAKTNTGWRSRTRRSSPASCRGKSPRGCGRLPAPGPEPPPDPGARGSVSASRKANEVTASSTMQPTLGCASRKLSSDMTVHRAESGEGGWKSRIRSRHSK
ncbi:hypothetical protein DFJ74DRAFT_693389 [Hyaloraphidium curvatum]|nr:hypothetical protein DFJ74DRAFT_693389 [Hyaloraphidium curvatum]